MVSDIQMFQSLKNKLGEKESKDLIEFIEAKSEQAYITKSDSFATKQDIFVLKQDLVLLKEELKSDIHNLRSDMHTVESKLTSKIYIIGLVQFIAIVGSVLGIVMLFVK